MPEIDGVQLPELRIQYNLLRPLDSKEIAEIRDHAVREVFRLLEKPWADIREDIDGGTSGEEPPFGAEVIETKLEAEPRFFAMMKQLIVSQRYLDERSEEDLEICGYAAPKTYENTTKRSRGVRLPLLSVTQRGRNATVTTRNTWGSVDYNDKGIQDELRRYMTKLSGLDESDCERVLLEFTKEDPETSYDIQVLREDDRVEIFNAQGTQVGSATVREATGDIVSLHIHGKMKLHRGCFLRRKSNRRALAAYKQMLFEYCARLGVATEMKDRRGDRYDWGIDPWQFGPEDEYDFSPTERAFFGLSRGRSLDNMICDVMERIFDGDDIPRALLGDTEQSVAFTLAAMGHPCCLIQGPSGTGKTMVAGHLVKHFNRKGLRTLVLSHSNRGLDVLLAAIKRRGPKVHRGGTEIGVCAKSLRDDFIRRDLHVPQRHDFLVEKFDTETYERAMKDHRDGQSPKREDFTTLELDSESHANAWREFNAQKQEILRSLREEEGLVAGVTLNSLISDEIVWALDFDVVIVDEASKGYIFELLPALKKAGKQIIFIGDHQQLRNIALPEHFSSFLKDDVKNFPEENDVTISAQDVQDFESGPFAFVAERTSIPQVMLRTNRRSLPGIVEMVSLAGYEGKLMAGRYDRDDPSNPGTMLWIDTSGRGDRFEKQIGVSKCNPLEARLIARRLADMQERGELDEGNFGVISMYSAQRRRVAAQVMRHPFGVHEHREQLLELLHGNNGTVDAFQGSERQKIFLSITSSNPRGRIGHTSDRNRSIVAISRSQDEFYLYGDTSTMIDGNPDLESQILYSVVYDCIERHGEVRRLVGGGEPCSRNARRNRLRRARRKAGEQESVNSPSVGGDEGE